MSPGGKKMNSWERFKLVCTRSLAYFLPLSWMWRCLFQSRLNIFILWRENFYLAVLGFEDASILSLGICLSSFLASFSPKGYFYWKVFVSLFCDSWKPRKWIKTDMILVTLCLFSWGESRNVDLEEDRGCNVTRWRTEVKVWRKRGGYDA